MNKIIKFKIITPEKVVYQDDILEATLPTESGEITVLPNHTPLITLAKTGEIRLKKAGQGSPVPLTISSGLIEIRESSIKDGKPTEIIVLASRSELVSDIDIERAKEAYDRAVKLLADKTHTADIDFARFQSLLDKEANRIKTYHKWRK